MTIKKDISQIISMWVHLKFKGEDGVYIPVCKHYSSKNGFIQTGLPRLMTSDKVAIVKETFASMTQDEIENLPTEEEFLQRITN
tara:strand:+ start:851 stop:1102 length:252 start_codon:yes stop_codon:yes gene_type:complete